MGIGSCPLVTRGEGSLGIDWWDWSGWVGERQMGFWMGNGIGRLVIGLLREWGGVMGMFGRHVGVGLG